ncbi:TPA: mannosyltransferase [Morganella morganii]|nr:mannosyltransferase [Morganella morganii]HDF2364662.1 mannosyltransferase [Morganella morganii]HDF2423482.1 mannosyltransferase [Morganella morganii]
MIPATIHYIWLGDKKIPSLCQECIDTWSIYAREFNIICWDEGKYFEYFGKNDFVVNMIKNKKFAFAADYIRCDILYKYGGIYLDTDMELVKDISDLLGNTAFIGNESPDQPSCGILGSTPNLWLFDKLKNAIEAGNGLVTIPFLLKKILIENKINISANNDITTTADISIYPQKYFYPYNPYDDTDINQLLYKNVTPDCYAIHHWYKSWKLSITERLIKKLKVILKK